MRTVSAILATVTIILGGCSNPPSVAEKPPFAQKIGQNCTVQLRRGDGLGAGGDVPVSLTTANINGADVSVKGKLRAVADGWIAIEAENTEYCIPREAILLVQFNKVIVREHGSSDGAGK